MAVATALSAQQVAGMSAVKWAGTIKITDLRCATIGSNPTVRIVTDQGISGYGRQSPQ